MCIEKRLSSKPFEISSMYSSKSEKTSSSDVDSPTRSYALIETDANELDNIIDVLRQFFPRTKITECNNQSHSSYVTPPRQSSNTNSSLFKGKVKDYLQRRYEEQMDEHQIRKDTFSKSRSLDSSSNKRASLQRYTLIDIDDDDDDDQEESPLLLPPPHPSSNSEQSNKNKTNLFLPPYHHLTEQEQEKRASSLLPLPPYSASSDPGPYHSPWFHTPTSAFNFRFPLHQEQAVANAQGSIAQLSTLTQMLCDEPSVFTPISPRFKIEKHDSNTSTDSSSIPPCQICREEFDSHQTYINHYRRHLEDSGDDEKSEINCDRPGDMRHFLCRICSKRFSRDMLNRHLRLHSGVRPYRCPMCNTNFSRSDHLSTHLRTHTGEKPYTCSHCSYSACRRDMITRHLKIHRKQRTERKNATSTNQSVE